MPTLEEELEEEHAYVVLAKRFRCSSAYIKVILQEHFESPSDAGYGHMGQQEMSEQEHTSVPHFTIDEIKAFLDTIDTLRRQGTLPPHKLSFRKLLKSDEELAMEDRFSVDSDGNLCNHGQIVKRDWIQSIPQRKSNKEW